MSTFRNISHTLRPVKKEGEREREQTQNTAHTIATNLWHHFQMQSELNKPNI